METPTVPTLAEYVRVWLDRLGKSQADLAADAGLSKSEINAIVKGRVKLPGPDKRRRLAAALGVLPYEILVIAGEYDPVLDGVPPATPDAASPDPVKARYVAMLSAIEMTKEAVMVLDGILPALVRYQGHLPIPAAGMGGPGDGGDGEPATTPIGAPSRSGTPARRRGG